MLHITILFIALYIVSYFTFGTVLQNGHSSNFDFGSEGTLDF